MGKARTKIAIVGFSVLLLVSPFSAALAHSKKIKKARAGDNPAEFAAFSKALSKDERFHYALERLTFGARPGDLAQIRAAGLNNWLEGQLHPEKQPENPLLEQRLEPLASLRLSIHELYARYPAPRMIAAVARGTGPLPEDPELRAVVVRLADRYLRRKNGQPGTPDPNDDADLDLKVKLSNLLSAEQINALQNGKPEEKRAVLAAIPPGQIDDFAWALRKQQRQQLIGLAPVALRRQLMLATNPQSVVASDLAEAKLLRAIYSTHQLQELLTDFWFNHFNVNLDKGADHYSVPSYERDVIRPHVFGRFYDLLLETAKSPAMLFYLDNWQSVGPDANRKNKRGLNENYGRELLELHTLGVDGGYTQQDVVAVARCFTGWTITSPREGGLFKFNDKLHDHGAKVVLGQTIAAGGGMDDGLKVLDMLAHRPATAHFISLRLAQRFVADNPPPALVNRMADTFLKTGGDLRKVLAAMLYSGEFWSQGSYRAKVKTPFEMVVSAVRASNADVTSALPLVNQIQRLGEPLYRKVEPTGYSSANAEWISSASLLDRMNFASALTHNRLPGVKVDVASWQALSLSDPLNVARSLLDEDPSEQTKAAIGKIVAAGGQPQTGSLVAGLTLGSPEFQRR